jgi:hypothetical protein
MWLEHGLWLSCRSERGSISPNCNKLDFESVVQLNFVASDPTTMTAASGAPWADNVSLVFACSRYNSFSDLRPLGLRFSACRLLRRRNQETVTPRDACSINQRRRFNRARSQHAFHGRRFGVLVGMGVVFATVKGEGGRSKPSTPCLCRRLMQILLAVTTMCLP